MPGALNENLIKKSQNRIVSLATRIERLFFNRRDAMINQKPIKIQLEMRKFPAHIPMQINS